MRKCVVSLLVCAVFTLAGCGKERGISRPSSVLLLLTDYGTGGIATVDPSGYSVTFEEKGIVHSDVENAVEREGYVYVFNRLGADNVQVLDPKNGFQTVAQVSTGTGSNPYDGVFLDDALLVSRYELSSLLLMKPLPDENSSPLENTSPAVDLSEYADSDGVPESAYMIKYNGRIYLALQRFVRSGFPWKVTDDGSLIAVIDPQSLKVEGTITLPSDNPVRDFVPWGDGKLLIACAGSYGAVDGGVDVIYTSDLTAGVLVSEENLGGDVNDVAVSGDGRIFALINSPDFSKMSVVEVNYPSGETSTIYSVDRFSLRDIEVVGEELWIGEASPDFGGVVVFDLNDFSSPVTRIPTSLPPSRILPLKGQ